MSPESMESERLILQPLTPADATEMVAVLSDPSLYHFTGGQPPTLGALEERYEAQTKGPGREGETWSNWIIRMKPEGEAIGFVQATIVAQSADVAWVVGTPWQGHGFASEAARAMVELLLRSDVGRITAHIHPAHVASHAVARSIGLERSTVVDEDGEEVWQSRGLT